MAPTYRKGVLPPYPDSFTTRDIDTDGVTIHTRVGGSGPAVVLLHGYGVTGDSWAHLAAALAGTHTVVAPDLRGLGLSSKPDGGYDKKSQPGRSWCCRSAGWSSAPSPGSIAAAGWPTTGKTTAATHLPSCASPPSASCHESSAIP